MTNAYAKTFTREPEIVAGRNGNSNPVGINRDELILPGGSQDFVDTAKVAFPVLAQQYRYFVRGGRAIVEIAYKKLLKDNQTHDVFQLLEPQSFRSRIEYSFICKAWRESKDGPKLKECRCSQDAAVVLLKTREAIEFLPHISTLAAAPVITGEQGNLDILCKGYHENNNGIYVLSGKDVPVVELGEAVKSILGLLDDYEFVTGSDKSRAIASFISPALHFGGLVPGDFPIDIAEADQSQSGKTYRQKLVSTLYGETSYAITKKSGGVGSLDESISTALVAGHPFILLDNFRGNLDSQLLESALRGAGYVNARVPHRGEIQVPVTHINWQLSSNGMNATRDLCNRSIITRVCKQKENFEFKKYPTGDLLSHIKANQAKFLGCVFAVVQEWDTQGRPRTDDLRHDFREWAQTLDWIVQNIFKLAPLLDGHTEEILRVSDPALSWLRLVAIVVEKDKRLDEELSASEISDICQAHLIEFPGVRISLNLDQFPMVTGKLLGRVFRETAEVSIDRYGIKKVTRQEYNHDRQALISKHFYKFEKPEKS